MVLSAWHQRDQQFRRAWPQQTIPCHQLLLEGSAPGAFMLPVPCMQRDSHGWLQCRTRLAAPALYRWTAVASAQEISVQSQRFCRACGECCRAKPCHSANAARSVAAAGLKTPTQSGVHIKAGAPLHHLCIIRQPSGSVACTSGAAASQPVVYSAAEAVIAAPLHLRTSIVPGIRPAACPAPSGAGPIPRLSRVRVKQDDVAA